MSLTEQEIKRRIEILLDRVADKIIESSAVTTDIIKQNQKTIRNGIITTGLQNSEKLILFESDTRANEEDLKSTAQLGNLGIVSLTDIGL